MSRFGVFKINGTDYDMDDLTLDEVEQIEELSGRSLSEMDFGSAKAMKAIAYTLIRRTDPTVEMADVGKVKLIDFVQGDEQEPELGPPAEGGEENQNGSDPVDSGAQASVASIAG